MIFISSKILSLVRKWSSNIHLASRHIPAKNQVMQTSFGVIFCRKMPLKCFFLSISWVSVSCIAYHLLDFVLQYYSVLNHHCFDNFWQVGQLFEQKIPQKTAYTPFTAFYGFKWYYIGFQSQPKAEKILKHFCFSLMIIFLIIFKYVLGYMREWHLWNA